MVELQDGFGLFLRRRGNAESSIRVKTFVIHKLLREIPALTREAIEQWLERRLDAGCSPRTIQTNIIAIRLYGQFIGDTEIAGIPFLHKVGQAYKATMSDEEVEQFLALPCNYKFTYRQKWWGRYTMFWQIVAYSGMRTGEVAGLRIGDVDFGRNVFVLQHTKTSIPRVVPIAPNIQTSLRQYIEVLEGEFLFAKRNGVPIDSRNWGENFHHRIERMGIKRMGLTPYSLRHSFITRLLEEDVNLFKVQKIVGHRNIETTAQYTHLTTKDIENAIKKHPLIRRTTEPKEILIALADLIKSFHLENDPRFNYRIEENDHSIRFEAYLR